ncbi:Aldehyde dehydrogenase [Synechococcus sp. MIT S9509]|nr:Aldehyde dehydrogenase [Synechococcus sp. MIT S9504]KZR88301.1 Aldehyde dehydrogenase [Synechococcus sp. MIT S9509]
MSSTVSTLIPVMVQANAAPHFTETDLGRLRKPVLEGITRPEAWRRAQLQRLRELVTEHEPEILEALRHDLAKPDLEGMAEVVTLLQELKLAERRLRAWMRPRRIPVPLVQKPGRAELIREPLGCVLLIGPWNLPFSLTLWPLVSALAAGNTAVIKPSEHAPATAELIEKLVPKHFQSDVVQVVNGDGAVAAQLVRQRFDHIFFTGGGKIGAKVLEGAAANLTPVTLELGGKNPAIVLPGADLSVTARRLIWGKGFNAGQACIAPDHLLVQSEQRAPLLQAIAEERLKLYGSDPLESKALACLIHDHHFGRLEALLKQAKDEGRVLIGGESDPIRRRIAPTLIAVQDEKDPLMTDELFGPLLPVLEITDLNDAIQRIQKQDKPLALYLFGGDERDQELVLRSTSSGGVCFNDVLMQCGVPDLPFGGVGASGMGTHHGEAGFRTFSHERSVLRRPFWLDLPQRYPPYTLKPETFRRLLS